MNKFVILILAICLVSVHAFVKRDAPAPAPAPENNYLNTIEGKFNEAKVGIEKVFKEITDPKKTQEMIDQLSANINSMIEQLKPKEAPKS